MIPRECKRLAEVDFPIAEVSRHAAREKSIRHGHPSTLHLWWARRPLASSRAVLLALLLPDPCDPCCPATFKAKAREILAEVRQPPTSDAELRAALLWFIGAFANWDMAAHPTYIRVGRNLVTAASGAEPPLVVDPFAGGGSIPLEALRLGCEAFASDLNPVACLILKVMLEDIPRHGPGLAEELRRVGGEIKRQAERELADLYPAAYLWARTVRCEAPSCGPRCRCCGRSGCAASPSASGRCATVWSALGAPCRRWHSRYSRPRPTARCRTVRWRGPGPRACAAARCCHPSECARSLRRNAAAQTWSSTARASAPAGRA